MTAAVSVKPWYREVWPWLLMLPPFASVVGGITMVYLAVGAPEALVVDDYARIEEITRERFAAEARAGALGLRANVTVAGQGDGRAAFAVVLTGAETFAPPHAITLRMQHAAHEAADRTLVLEQRDGAYRGATDLRSGRYALELEPADGEWRLSGAATAASGTFELGPAVDAAAR